MKNKAEMVRALEDDLFARYTMLNLIDIQIAKISTEPNLKDYVEYLAFQSKRRDRVIAEIKVIERTTLELIG